MKPQPTAVDIANAECRLRLAEKAREAYDAAVAACGPGADRYGHTTLIDRAKEEPPRRVYQCQRSGVTGWQPPVETPMVQMTPEQAERVGQEPFVINGATVYPFRYETWFGSIELYEPLDADGLAAARVAREKGKLRREAQKYPLLAGQIYEEASHQEVGHAMAESTAEE
jgi:hypothetical protein